MATATIETRKVKKVTEVEEQVVNLQLTLEEAATLRAVAGYTHTDTAPGAHIGNLYNILSTFQNREMKAIPERRVTFETTQTGTALRIHPK